MYISLAMGTDMVAARSTVLKGVNAHLCKYKPPLKLRLHVVQGDSSPPQSVLANMLSRC